MKGPRSWKDEDSKLLLGLIPEVRRGTTDYNLRLDNQSILLMELNEGKTKVDLDRPYWVVLKDDPEDWSFFEVAFWDGKSNKSVLRSDLMAINDFTPDDLMDSINDLNSDNKLDKQWKWKDLLREAAPDGGGETSSSLGDFEEAIIIGFNKPFNQIDFIPFANWDIPPEFLEPEIEVIEEELELPEKEQDDDSDNPYKKYEDKDYEPWKKKGWEDYNPWMKKDDDDPSAATQANYLNK
jgi:hypothetical protein|tara:strand:+ start:1072 stop:1785 length:714 start_codon:yes stop_codon:yes gene_type:complete